MTRRMNPQLMIEVRQSQCPYQVRIHNRYVHIYICIFIDSNLFRFFHFYWFQNGIKDAAYYQVDHGAVLRASQQHVVFINLFMQPASRYLLFFSLNIFYFDNVCFHWIERSSDFCSAASNAATNGLDLNHCYFPTFYYLKLLLLKDRKRHMITWWTTCNMNAFFVCSQHVFRV